MPFSEAVLARLDADAAQIIGQYPQSRSALLPLLHLVQSEEGYVSADGIEFCAAKLGLTEADVTGVVSFYTMYKRRPVGEYHVGVCTNTRSWPSSTSTSAWATTRPRPTAGSAWSTWSATPPACTRRW
jgi:NADH:ubiquinone oxidoreductase subunit E